MWKKCFNGWIGALALAGGSVPVAYADDAGAYLGVGLGVARHPKDSTLDVQAVRMSGETHRNEDLAWSVSAGYRVNSYFALEAGYLDLGDTAFTVADTSTGSFANGHFRAKGAAWSVIGLLPLGQWEPYVKAGILYSNTQLSFAGNVSGAQFVGSTDGDKQDALYGVGVGLRVSEHWAAKFDLTFVNVGEPRTGQSDVAIVTLGVTYRF